MLTETEKRALQLAKKVFEHFTHDALPIAREILALEEELGKTATESGSTPGQQQSIEAKQTNGNIVSRPVSTIRVAPQSLNLPAGIMMGSKKEPSMALSDQENGNSFPF